MTRAVRGAALAGVLILAGCADQAARAPAPPPDAIPAGTVLGSASISGKVLFAGRAEEPREIETSSDAACQHRQDGAPRREDLVVGPGGAVRWCLVRVTSGLPARPFAPPADPIRLDQRGCTYRPHVVGVQVGQPLLIVNSDPTLHNVHTFSTANKPFNFGMSVEGQKATRYFSQPEVMIKAKCDVHPWMAAWIGVIAHPFYAVTSEDGAFELRELPAGEYTLEVWHETLGTQVQRVTVGDGERREITFTYPG